MDLDFSEEQEMLREMVRGVCAEFAPIEAVRASEDDPKGFPDAFWKQLAELDLLGLTLPAEYGGTAQSAFESAIVYEEFGRALAPSPHFVSSVVSAGLIAQAGHDEQRRHWLPRIVSGEAILTPAWLEPDRGFGPLGVALEARPAGSGFRLTGVKRHVAFASAATQLIVLARTGPGAADVDAFFVDPGAEGVRLTQQTSLASDAQYKVEFEDVSVDENARIGGAQAGWRAWSEVSHDALIALAAQAIGGARRAFEITNQYALDREQFDKPLGAFQSIAHYLADAITRVDGGETLVYEAAWARSQGRPVDRLAPMAKLFASSAYKDVTKMALQIHGGMGFTIEFDIQLFFRRAKQLQIAWWDDRFLEDAIARSVLDG